MKFIISLMQKGLFQVSAIQWQPFSDYYFEKVKSRTNMNTRNEKAAVAQVINNDEDSNILGPSEKSAEEGHNEHITKKDEGML